MRATVALLLLLPLPLLGQHAPPRILYIYRDSLKRGVDSTYRAIEDQAAQICVDLKCPNPYLALEALAGPTKPGGSMLSAVRRTPRVSSTRTPRIAR